MTIVLSSFALVAAAQALVGLRSELGERVPFVEQMLDEAGLPPDAPWDLAFVHHAGWQAHRHAGTKWSSWPFGRHATHDQVGAIAVEQGAAVRSHPIEGDLVLYHASDTGLPTRAGIVTRLVFVEIDVDGRAVYRCKTIEGHVTEPGEPRVGFVREVERTVRPEGGDLLVRWVLLDAR